MEQELLAWAQVAVRELMFRGHASLQTLLMVTLFQAQPSTRKVLKNYLPYLEKPSDHLGVCRLYARAGLVEELRQAMQERPLSESDMYHLVRAGARGGHWSIIEPYQDSMRTRYDCLFVAVKRGHLDIIQRVTAYESVGHSGLALLAQQAIHCGRVDIFKAVLSALATARTGHNNFLWELAEIQSVLTAAVESYDPEMVRAALQGMQIPFAILDFEAQAACQKPASTVALMCPFLETRPQLLNALLVAACEKGNMEIAQYMLERGASALDDALEACYEHRNIEMVQFLLDRGARDPTGYLVAYGGPQIAALLLRVGATKDGKNRPCGVLFGRLEKMPRSKEPTNYSRWNQALRGVDVASLMEIIKDNMCHGTCFYWGLQGGTKEPERQRLLRQVVVRIHYQLSLEELLRVSFHSSHSRFRYNKALFYFLLWMVKEFSRLHFSELEGLPAELQPLTLSGLKKIYHQREYMKYRALAEAAWDACAAQCE